MDKISNHRERQIDYVVTYLKEFANINETNASNGVRWQYLEELFWFLLQNLNIETAKGYWLDLLGEKAGQDRTLPAEPDDLFLFDCDDEDLNGFGDTIGDGVGGNLLDGIGFDGQSYISLDDELYRLVIKFAIIKNNFDGRRQTIIDAIKLLTKAHRVLITSNPPLAMDLTIKADIPEDFKAGFTELIETIMPQCVELQHIYIEDVTNSFQFNSETRGLDNGVLDTLI